VDQFRVEINRIAFVEALASSTSVQTTVDRTKYVTPHMQNRSTRYWADGSRSAAFAESFEKWA